MNKILLSPTLLIYNASAGSGKTTTLLREILQLAFSEETINNEQTYKNIKIRNILGLTFTNAVAAELKSRLFDILSHTIKKDTVYYEKIKKAYFANESSELTDKEITEKANQLLRYLLHHYSDLSLMTIDSFSNRLLKSFAYELKHPFVYNIATNKDDYYEKSLDYFLDTIDNEKIQWYLKYILSKKYEDDEKYNINKLNNEILKIFKALDEKEIPGEYLIKLQQNLKNINENQLQEKITKKISELNDEIRTIIKTTGEKYGYFFINNDNEPEQFKNSLIDGRRFITIISIYNSENVYENLLKSYLKDEKWKSDFFKKNIKDKDSHEKNIREIINDKIITKCQKLQLCLKLLERISITKIALELKDILSELKKENQVMFFSDFTREISKIIQQETNADFIYEKTGIRYQHILFDEFQDTSQIQFHNLLPLIHNNMSGGNINFIVGDPKQSIYLWRNANVKQFVDLFYSKEIDFELLKKSWNNFKTTIDSLTLNNNYRSAKNIVEFNNKIFNNLEYENNKLVKKVYQNAEQHAVKQDNGYVEVITIDYQKKVKFNAFLQLCYSIITKCLNDGYKPKDICILLRTNEEIRKCIEFFSDKTDNENKPLKFISPEGLIIYTSPDVDFIISFMNLLIDSENNIADAICRNYVYSKDNTSIYGIECGYSGNFIKDFVMQNSEISRFFNAENLASSNIYQIALNIINCFKIPLNSYVLQLLDIIQQFIYQHATTGNTLYDFLLYWEKFKNTFTLSSNNEADAIKIMTIHKSKGLEFPVVINYLNYKNKESEYWQYIPEDFVLSITSSEKESLNINEFSGLLFYLPLKDIELIDSQKYEELKEEEILESINTMYVSFTRAIERLYIIADKENVLYKKLLNPKISDYKNNNEEKYQKSESVISSVDFISGKEEKKLPDEIKNESDSNTIIIQHSNLNNKNNILLSSDEIKYSDERMWGIKVHRMIEFLENSNIDKAISKGIVNGVILSEETEEIRNILNNIVRHPVLSDFFDEEKTECIYNEPEIFSFDDTILSDSIDIKRPDKIILTKDNKVILLEFKTGIQDEKHKLQLNKYLHVVRNIYKNKRICEGYLIYVNGDNITVEKV